MRAKYILDLTPEQRAILEPAFWRRARRNDTPNECWTWAGRPGGSGYAACYLHRVRYYAHRLSWILHFGPIPDGLHVCHTCDNRMCVRPDHLFLGTQLDNMQDASSKGRVLAQAHPERLARGDRHGSKTHPEKIRRGAQHGSHIHPESVKHGQQVASAKLTDDDVREIRHLLFTGTHQRDCARRFGVTQAAISCIARGLTWRQVP